jgi:hypothetical protein
MRLRTLAWINLCVHALGLGAALAMRPGTGLVSVEERIGVLASAPLAWGAGWAIWMICALVLFAFFFTLADELATRAARAALAIVSVALAVDLFCDAGQMAVLPAAAHAPAATFLVVERLVGVGGTLVANGLYSLAAVIVSLSLTRRLERVLGLGVGMFGALMAAGGVADSALLVAIATGPTILLFCGWAIAVARRISQD